MSPMITVIRYSRPATSPWARRRHPQVFRVVGWELLTT